MPRLPELTQAEVDAIAARCQWFDEDCDGNLVECHNIDQFYREVHDALQRKLNEGNHVEG